MRDRRVVDAAPTAGRAAEAFRQVFSAIHHMEWIGLALAEQFCELAANDAEREFAAAQKREEGRHVAVCRRLARLFGELEPASPHLDRMKRALVDNPHRAAKLLGLLGGDIMGDFLIRRLLTTALPEEARAEMIEILGDEVRHIRFLSGLLERELSALGRRERASCVWTQLVLLYSDVRETSRLAGYFEAIGLDPRIESMMCYLYYRERMAPLRATGSILIAPEWLVRLGGPASYRAAERALTQLGHLSHPIPGGPVASQAK